MRRLGIAEEEAYHRLQKQASTRNRRLVDVAREVVSAEEVFCAMERGPG